MYNFQKCSYIHYMYRLSAFIYSFICSHIRTYVCIFANLCVADYCAFAWKFKTIKFFFLKRKRSCFFSALAGKNKNISAFMVCLCNSIFWFLKLTQLPHVSSKIIDFSSYSVLILVISDACFVPHLIIRRRRNSLAIKIYNQPQCLWYRVYFII